MKLEVAGNFEHVNPVFVKSPRVLPAMANLGRFPVDGGRISLNVEFVDEVGCDGTSRMIDVVVDHPHRLLGHALFFFSHGHRVPLSGEQRPWCGVGACWCFDLLP